MTDPNLEEKVRTTVVISPQYQFTKEDLKRWTDNLLKFSAPTLAIFFGQLAAGVPMKAAFMVALLAFYGAAADFWNKYKSETLTK